MTDVVPTIDFDDFRAGGQRKIDFSLALVESLSRHGFIKIRNHQLGRRAIEDAFRWVWRMFTVTACWY